MLCTWCWCVYHTDITTNVYHQQGVFRIRYNVFSSFSYLAAETNPPMPNHLMLSTIQVYSFYSSLNKTCWCSLWITASSFFLTPFCPHLLSFISFHFTPFLLFTFSSSLSAFPSLTPLFPGDRLWTRLPPYKAVSGWVNWACSKSNTPPPFSLYSEADNKEKEREQGDWRWSVMMKINFYEDNSVNRKKTQKEHGDRIGRWGATPPLLMMTCKGWDIPVMVEALQMFGWIHPSFSSAWSSTDGWSQKHSQSESRTR